MEATCRSRMPPLPRRFASIAWFWRIRDPVGGRASDTQMSDVRLDQDRGNRDTAVVYVHLPTPLVPGIHSWTRDQKLGPGCRNSRQDNPDKRWWRRRELKPGLAFRASARRCDKKPVFIGRNAHSGSWAQSSEIAPKRTKTQKFCHQLSSMKPTPTVGF